MREQTPAVRGNRWSPDSRIIDGNGPALRHRRHDGCRWFPTSSNDFVAVIRSSAGPGSCHDPAVGSRRVAGVPPRETRTAFGGTQIEANGPPGGRFPVGGFLQSPAAGRRHTAFVVGPRRGRTRRRLSARRKYRKEEQRAAVLVSNVTGSPPARGEGIWAATQRFGLSAGRGRRPTSIFHRTPSSPRGLLLLLGGGGGGTGCYRAKAG